MNTFKQWLVSLTLNITKAEYFLTAGLERMSSTFVTWIQTIAKGLQGFNLPQTIPE